jgi:hypothetical protein
MEQVLSTSIVPEYSSLMFHTSHFFICKVSDNFKHSATVTVPAEDFSFEVWCLDNFPVAEGESSYSSNDPSGVIEVSHQEFIHICFLQNNYN